MLPLYSNIIANNEKREREGERGRERERGRKREREGERERNWIRNALSTAKDHLKKSKTPS